MKKILCAVLLTVLGSRVTYPEPWTGLQLTLTPGTAQRLVKNSIIASSLFIQMNVGGTGVGYVLSAPIGVTCAKGGAGTTWIATLQAATSTAPGGNITIPSNPDPQGGINVALYCVDGAQSDTVTVAWNQRN